MKALLSTTANSTHAVHLGYTPFIKQEVKSREHDAIKRCGKHEMQGAAAGIT